MVFRLLVAFLITGIVFVVAEMLRRRLGMSNEVSRKQLHVLRGLFAASVPFIASMQAVIIIETAFLIGVVIARYTGMFKWMWQVGRKSWGELYYPISVILVAIFAQSEWIYLAAILELALADAAAAVIGKHWGRGTRYTIFGQQKSVIGSVAFFVVSCVILGTLAGTGHIELFFATIPAVFGLSLLLTATENLGVYGSDNLLIPLVAVVVLNLS